MNSLVLKFITFCIVLLVNSLTLADEKTNQNIIGSDNRLYVSNPYEKPYSMVGSLTYMISGRTGKCTASLVGPDLILTNSHCVVTKGARQSYVHHSFKFRPQYQKGLASPEIDATWIEYGSKDPIQQASVDWAILQLAEPIGNSLGYFHVSGIRANNSNGLIGKTISTIGYPADKSMGEEMWTQFGCKFTGMKGDINTNNYRYFKHSCDTAVGSSGSPLFAKEGGNYVIYGLHSRGGNGAHTNENVDGHNSAVQPHDFYDAIKRNQYKSDYIEVEIDTEAYCQTTSQNNEVNNLANSMKKIEKFLVSEKPATFYLCNPSDKNYKLAWAYEKINKATDNQKAEKFWVSEGYKNISTKKCEKFEVSNLKTSEAYIFVEGWVSEDKQFCIKKENSFKLEKADGQCPDGSSKAPFSNKLSISHDSTPIMDLKE